MTEQNRCKSLDDAIAILESVLVFNSEEDYLACLLMGGHSRMGQLLPSNVCLYHAFEGKKSSGKSTATKCMSHIVKNGKMYASVTPASLRRMCEEEVTLCIDEVDALARTDENIGMILRTGNTWDAVASICHKVDGEWQNFDIKIGGPKVFNFRGSLDDALRSRCYVISMPSCKDHEIIRNGMMAKERLRPVSDWLDEQFKDAINPGGWGVEKTKAHFLSSEFMEKWKGLGGDLGRNVGQAGVLLLTSDFFGWQMENRIKAMMDSQIPEDPYLTEKDIIADIYSAIKHDGTERNIEGLCVPKVLKISSEELRQQLNECLRAKGLHEYSKKGWGFFRKEIGWVFGLNEIKDSRQGGRHILFFDDIVLRSLGILGPIGGTQ